MSRLLRLVSIWSVALAVALSASPASALDPPGATEDFVLQRATTDDAYGVYGQIYRYDWDRYVAQGPKNVASIYMNDPEYLASYGIEWFIEIGMQNEYRLEWATGESVWTFLAWAEPGTGRYKGPYRQAPMPSVGWASYEINNHQMWAPGATAWYAAWNGHTVLHGLKYYGYFYEGQPFAASERWTWFGDSRSSFRYMQYKRPQGNYAAWPGMYTTDSDPLYDCRVLDTYPVKFYMWRDGVAP